MIEKNRSKKTRDNPVSALLIDAIKKGRQEKSSCPRPPKA